MTAAELELRGDLADPSFLDWICHRADLLDLGGWVAADGPHRVIILVSGPAPLIDAMEMACSLGPATIDVRRIETRHRGLKTAPNGFQKVEDLRLLLNF